MKKILRKATVALGYGGMYLLLPMMFLTTADVILRGLFRKPIMGTVEISSLMLVAFVLSGLAFTELERGHIRMELLKGKLGPRGRRVLEAFAALIGIGVSALFLWQGLEIGIGERQVSDMLRIPERPLRLLLPLCALLLGGHFLLEFLDALKRGKEGHDP